MGGGCQEEDNGIRDEPGAFEKYSKAKVLILQPFFLWNRDYDPTVINSIKAHNPDIKILAYISAHATWEHWIDIDEDKYFHQAAWDKAIVVHHDRRHHELLAGKNPEQHP